MLHLQILQIFCLSFFNAAVLKISPPWDNKDISFLSSISFLSGYLTCWASWLLLDCCCKSNLTGSHQDEVSPIVLVAKFFSSPSSLSSLLCTMHPALFTCCMIRENRVSEGWRFDLCPKDKPLPTRAKTDAAPWRPLQTPTLCVTQTSPQCGRRPPEMHRISVIFQHRSASLQRYYDSLCSPTRWWWPPWPLRLCICSYKPCELSRLRKNKQTPVFCFLFIYSAWPEVKPWAACTSLGNSHGSHSADPTVGSSDHERPSYNGHIQVLRLKVLSCCFIALPTRNATKCAKKERGILMCLNTDCMDLTVLQFH